MAKIIEELSVFFPTYNEEDSIRTTVQKARKVLGAIADRWEIIIVNDGSTDQTHEIAQKLSKEDRRIRVINHAPNRGYGAALKSGFYNSRYSWIAFTDSDGQFDFSEITNFIKKQKETGADLVIGYYKKRRVSFFKIVTSRLWEVVVFILFGLKARDIDCGFKFISKGVIKTIPKLESERGAFISSEFLIKARKSGFKIVEIPVTHYPRTKGAGTGRKLNVIIKSFIDLFRLWGKLYKEAIILGVILLVGAFVRLYRISEYMTFLGDEGRDAIIVRRLLVYLDPILIGPGTSIGNMYLGPLYYYMMAPALFLAGFSPVGPALQIALLGVGTAFFVWYVSREWFGPIAAGTAALLYAISPTVIVHSRSSWNPNIMPFFGLLCIYSVWRVWEKKDFKWFIVLGAAYAFVLQSHYLGLLLFPVILIFAFFTIREIRSTKREIRDLLKYSLVGLSVFIFLMLPLLFFDIRHNFMNFNALRTFVSTPQGNFSLNFLANIWPTFKLIITRLLAGRNEIVGTTLAVFFVLVLIYRFFEKSLGGTHFRFLLIWLGVGILGLSFYKHEIYDHYFGFLFTAPFLLIGGLTQGVAQRASRFGKAFVCASFMALVVVNLYDNPIRYSPNRQMGRAEEVARKILDESKAKRFNLAVLAERNYEDGYRYFLEVAGVEVLHADVWKPKTISDQLFVVCERPKEECKPTTDPKAEVANFGMSKIENEWEVGGVILYKLVHTK